MANKGVRYAIGIDLGGTKIEMGVVDEKGEIHERMRLETLVEEGDGLVQERILKGIKALQKAGGVPISGIGIGVAGQIELNTGTVIFAPNLKWDNVPLKANIEKAVRLPIGVFNDVRAITLGEWLYGAGKGCQDILCVFIGTGIGGGVVSGGRLMTGHTNSYGEVGHMTIDYKGPMCTCGKRGCFEAFAGGWGIAARAKDAIHADGQKSASKRLVELAGGDVNRVTAKIVVEAYRHHDPMAEELMNELEKALAAGLESLVNLYNPRRLILGGGLIDGLPEIVPILEKRVRATGLKAATQSMEVVKALLGKEVGVVGSAAAVFNLIGRGSNEGNAGSYHF